jgi:TolA-binding protein
MDKAVKISILIPAIFLAVFVLSGCSKKSEEVTSQSEVTVNEVQSKIDEQQAKINELQDYKDNQERIDEEKINQEKNQQIQKDQNQEVQNQSDKKILACTEANRLQSEIKDNCMMPYPGMKKCISGLKETLDKFKNEDSKGADSILKKTENRLNKLAELKPLYLKACEECGIEAR